MNKNARLARLKARPDTNLLAARLKPAPFQSDLLIEALKRCAPATSCVIQNSTPAKLCDLRGRGALGAAGGTPALHMRALQNS